VEVEAEAEGVEVERGRVVVDMVERRLKSADWKVLRRYGGLQELFESVMLGGSDKALGWPVHGFTVF
jgi:hypothetical protein